MTNSLELETQESHDVTKRSSSRKVIFLDRDGVINQRASPHDYVKTWNEFKFLPGSIDALKLLVNEGYEIVIITNQAGIARV